MSALHSDRTPRPASDDTGTRTRRPVLIQGGASTRRLARIPFLLVLIGIFGIGMAGLLALNTTLQGQAFEARTLHERANQLTYQEAALTRRVDELRSVDNLAARASKLGMRANPDPAFVQLPDGKVIGRPESVSGEEIPSLVVKTPEQLAAEKEAREAKQRAAEARRQAREAKREADRAARQQREQRSDQQNQQSAGGQVGADTDADADDRSSDANRQTPDDRQDERQTDRDTGRQDRSGADQNGRGGRDGG